MAFVKPVTEVDEVESPEGEIIETPNKQQTQWLRGLLLWPSPGLRKIRPWQGPGIGLGPPYPNGRWTSYPMTAKTPYRSTHRRSPRLSPRSLLYQPHHIKNRIAPSTPKRMPRSRTRGKSTPRRNGEGDAEDGLALHPRDSRVEEIGIGIG